MKLENKCTCMRRRGIHYWSNLLGKSCNYQNQYTAIRKCVADVNQILNQVTPTYPISELGQNIVDYWTHLMLKTNTSYFTGSSQLNKRFFFFIFVTPSEIYIHMAAYRQFLSFDFSFNNIKSTDCMRHPFCNNSEAASGISKKTYRRSISRWDFGDKLCVKLHLSIVESLCLQSK